MKINFEERASGKTIKINAAKYSAENRYVQTFVLIGKTCDKTISIIQG
ncbi:MAG: hypothetical protein WAO52_17585 [Prolixibacteraceae bacterium]